MRDRRLLGGLLGLLVAGTASAQSPVQRDSIERFRSEVAAIEDSVVLLDMESAMIAVAREDRDNALLHVRLGFLAYRLGEVTERNSHYDNAAGEFEWSSEIEPHWPYAWYGLGLAELAMGESSFIPFENIRQALGKDFLSKAVSAFSRAAAADPAFAVAVVDLAEAAMQQKIRPRVEVALQAVREAASTDAAHVPEVQLVRGRVERMAGDADSAVAAFERYLEVGGDTGVAYFEIARSLYFVGRPRQGQEAYFRGAAFSASEFATELYREDLSWVAAEERLEEFDAVPVGEREDWLEAFWWERDAGDLRIPGERLAEHYRRYFYALEHYPLVSRHRRYDVVNPYRNAQQVFDDRGIIYVRHGEPDRVAYDDPASPLSPNQSWLYYRPDQILVFHFLAADDVQDYKLVESLADVLGASEALRLQTGVDSTEPLGRAAALFNSRNTLDPVYQRLATFSTNERSRLLTEERRAGERSIRIGTTTDAFPLRYEALLDGTAHPYVVGDTTGSGWQLLLVYSVPGSALIPEISDDGATYRLSTRVLVRTPEEEIVVYVDSTSEVSSDHVLDDGEHVTGFLAVPVPLGELTVRVALDQNRRAAGQVLEDTVEVPDLEAEPVAVSDLIVGREDSELTWVSGSDTVNLTPSARFPPTVRLQVYYELHGLERGAPYRSRLEVKKEGGGSILGFFKRLFGGGGPPISLTFDGLASGRISRILQTVDISDLEPGRYRLRVIVEDPQGNEEFERESVLEVEGT
jgi:GWxTD domain-containing protein